MAYNGQRSSGGSSGGAAGMALVLVILAAVAYVICVVTGVASFPNISGLSLAESRPEERSGQKAERPAGKSVEKAKAYALTMLEEKGMADQYNCLVRLWNGESGWNYQAENPSSKAYGIPQSLPANKMASAGADWRDNPYTQIDWGLTYIYGRYGTPCKAWAFWQRTDARPYPGNWY